MFSETLRKSRRSVNTDLTPAGSQRVGRSTGGESATKGQARNRPFSDDARVERWTFRAVLMLAPVAFVTKVFVTRSIWSWVFEVLPVFLLAMQSLAAVSNHGDVDGRSSQPLFAPALRCGDVWMSSANAKIQSMLGRWSIQERHNIDEFMEGVDTCARVFVWRTHAHAIGVRYHTACLGLPTTMLCFIQCFRLIPQRSSHSDPSPVVCTCMHARDLPLCYGGAALGFASWQRALIARAGQSTTLEHGVDKDGDTLRIVTQDLRGTSQLELPLSGSDVAADDGDNGARVHRAATIERGLKPSVVVTERYPHEREPYSICRRTLQPDGRMCIEVQKRTGERTHILRPLFYLVATSPVPPRFDRVRPLVPRGSTY